MDKYEYYMKKALELAKNGWGRTNPNPLVGAVIVKDDEIIAQGYHEVLGGPHAEVSAFNNAKANVEGSTMFVSLEPCSHYGRTPPCAQAIIKAGVKEVVIAMEDPNPKVAGRGMKMLEEAGIKVVGGVMEAEARKLNEIFIKYITRKLPFVIMKTAMTIDGKIAAVSGDSKWITGESARQHVHMIRDRVSAIMVGVNTVLADDPMLTTRLLHRKGKDAVRVVVDSKGRIPLDSKMLNIQSNAGTILATTDAIPHSKEKALLEKGVRIIKARDKNGQVDLKGLMSELYKLEIDSVLLEGGGNLNYSALECGMVDKVMFFIAPKVIGGSGALTPVEGQGICCMKDAMGINNIDITRFDDDILLEGYVEYQGENL